MFAHQTMTLYPPTSAINIDLSLGTAYSSIVAEGVVVNPKIQTQQFVHLHPGFGPRVWSAMMESITCWPLGGFEDDE